MTLTPPALAQSALGLSAIPPRLEVKANPGQVITQEIKIRNESKTEKIISTFVKDFIVTDDKGTPIQLENVDESENRWAAGSWIQVSPSSFTIKPGETKALSLTILTPDDATPGGHYAMVLHSPKNETILSESGSAIEANVGTLVYVTIPGNIRQDARVRQFSVPGFSEYGPVEFKTTIDNLSDIHISPIGAITVTNMLGQKTTVLPLENTNIFPLASRHFQNTLNQKWLLGRYMARLEAGYGTAGGALVDTLFFWVIPWRLLILLFTFIAIVVTLTLINRRSRVGFQKQSTEKIEELEEELQSLKSKYRDRK